jgi:hypothetical protein
MAYTTQSAQELFEICLPSLSCSSNESRIIFARGSEMRDLRGLYRETSAAWQFPYYFGFNSAALVDCLSDLSWMPAASYCFVILSAYELLGEENSDQLRGLLLDLSEISRRWREDMSGLTVYKQQSTDFVSIFQVSRDEEGAFLDRLRSLGIATPNKAEF